MLTLVITALFFLSTQIVFSARFPKAVANVYLAMLTRSAPTFQEENIVSIVNNLYSHDLKVEANKIVNIYEMKGYTS